MRTKGSHPGANPLGHTFTLPPLPLDQQVNPDPNGEGLVSALQGSFPFAMRAWDTAVQSRCPEAELRHLFPETLANSPPPLAERASGAGPPEMSSDKQPATAVTHAFNFTFVC